MLEKKLREKLRFYPGEYWLITRLANALYEQKKYKPALKYSEKAMSMASDDPLVVFDHAPILKMNGDIPGAIRHWKSIEKMSLNKLAFGKYGEGMKWAKSIKNNVYFHMAIAYKDLNDLKNFKKYLRKNIDNRERGVFSQHPKSEALKLYKKYFE